MDENLLPIAAFKLDNCLKTNGFDGEIDASGNLYNIRRIDKKTIISKLTPDNFIGDCPIFPQMLPNVALRQNTSFVGFDPSDFPLSFYQDSTFEISLTQKTGISMDFCERMDASFQIEDSVCIGTTLLPWGVDTTQNYSPYWTEGNFTSQVPIPTFDFLQLGQFTVTHQLSSTVCKDTAMRIVTVLLSPEINVQDTIVCGPNSLSIDLTNGGTTQYYLDGVPTNPIIEIKNSGNYHFKLENIGCFTQKNVNIRIVPFEPPQLIFDSIACLNELINVNLWGDFEAIYWDGQGGIDTFKTKDGNDHRVQAVAKVDSICSIDLNFSIDRKNCQNIDLFYVPNVFSPNNDGKDDFFEVFSNPNAEVKRLQIYDRWGNLIWEGSNNQPKWDGYFRGKLVTSGIYTYVISFFDNIANVASERYGEVLVIKT
jgi:gliding motility-associated-like protein